MVGGGGRHVERIGNRENKANSRGLLYDSLGGLTRPKGPLKHRGIPSDLGEIPINKYLLHLSLKPKEIPNDLGEIPILLSYQTCPRIATNHFPETRRNPQ